MGARLSFIGCIFLLIPGTVWGQDRLNEKQVSCVLEELLHDTSPAWIKTGTIKATHIEYRAAKTTEETRIQERIIQEAQRQKQVENSPYLVSWLQEMQLEALPFNVRYKLSNEYTMETSHHISFDGVHYNYQRTVVSRRDSVERPQALRYNSFARDSW